MNKIKKIFYINLLRRPDRNDFFLNSCKKAKIPLKKIERFEAFDGQIYKPTDEEKLMFINCNYSKKKFYNNILCNQLGHYYLLKEIINRKYKYAIICQDDIYFKNNFIDYINNLMENIPPNSEIINLGNHLYAVGDKFKPWNLLNTSEEDFNLIGKKKINNFICELNNNYNPCSLAYIVTLQGAINLVEYFNNNGFKKATDINYNNYCIEKNIYYSSLPILCTGNPELGSDIFY